MGESTYGNMRLLKQLRSDGVVPLLGLQNLDDILHVPVAEVKNTVNVRNLCPTPSLPAFCSPSCDTAEHASMPPVRDNNGLNLLRSLACVGCRQLCYQPSDSPVISHTILKAS